MTMFAESKTKSQESPRLSAAIYIEVDAIQLP